MNEIKVFSFENDILLKQNIINEKYFSKTVFQNVQEVE